LEKYRGDQERHVLAQKMINKGWAKELGGMLNNEEGS
jgi:hypothetical protein